MAFPIFGENILKNWRGKGIGAADESGESDESVLSDESLLWFNGFLDGGLCCLAMYIN